MAHVLFGEWGSRHRRLCSAHDGTKTRKGKPRLPHDRPLTPLAELTSSIIDCYGTVYRPATGA
jgi:hypothetical protein